MYNRRLVIGCLLLSVVLFASGWYLGRAMQMHDLRQGFKNFKQENSRWKPSSESR